MRPTYRILTIAAALALASCGGGSSSSSSTSAAPTSTPSTTAVSTATGPATAQLTFAGDQALAGALTKPTISCSFPGFDSLAINVFAHTIDPNISTLIVVTSSAVHVRIDSGSGASYHERDFSGTGVSGYDPAGGAHVDSSLSETAGSTGTTAGTLAAVEAINGDIGCGAQRPGSSTIVLSGDTGSGSVTGTLNPVRVACFTSSTGTLDATAIGIANVGTARALTFVTGQPDSFTVSFAIQGGPTRVFRATGAGSSVPTAQGMHVSGDTVEQGAAAGTAHTVHVEGDAVCGSTIGQ